MKKIILSLLCLCFISSVQSQTIHWLTFIDTNDKNIGEMDKNGQALLFSRFRNVVNAALSTAGYKSDNQEFFGTRLSPQNCKSAIQSLQCSSNDIVIFYYIGHGTHAAKENNNYPQMMMGKGWSDERLFIPLKWVHDQLSNKGARLNITIGMCCNPIQSASAKNAPTFSSSAFSFNYGNAYLSDQEIDQILKLFLEQKGSIIQATASVGECSWGYGFNDMGMIDSFTRFLILQFEQMTKHGSDTTWKGFLDAIGNNVITLQKQIVSDNPRFITEARQNGYSPYQTPFNEVNVIKCTRPRLTPEPKQAPEPKSQPKGVSTEEIISDCLAYIIDRNISLDERIDVIQKFESMFTSNAMIKIISQDGDVVVDKETPDRFLGRISTSRILLDVVLDDFETNANGKITELRVKEYYKK